MIRRADPRSLQNVFDWLQGASTRKRHPAHYFLPGKWDTIRAPFQTWTDQIWFPIEWFGVLAPLQIGGPTILKFSLCPSEFGLAIHLASARSPMLPPPPPRKITREISGGGGIYG